MTGLFVYGTLKQGGSNHHLVAPLLTDVLKDCYVYGDLYSTGPYTALVTPGTEKISGELLVTDSIDELLRITDQLEGDEYERLPAEIYQEPNTAPARLAWVYRYAKDPAQLKKL